ncbi:uncharacterized protein H6S33_010268 [Morchella sextelata]|uniref:uncharacterized protein n=1 Tax=Morchella sextelata TaxID=1174677 RepID=UPI001D0538C0|nr:uncharacterized protein H6S33_010268 [Morchella sextelata]KAH0612216.1 hypothetical protein H6S33_010268 [Morchella sextelata]
MEYSTSVGSEQILSQDGVGGKEVPGILRHNAQYIDIAELEQPIRLREMTGVIEQLEADAENFLDEISIISSSNVALNSISRDAPEMDPVYLGISADPTGKTTEEQLREYNEYSVAAGFPDLSHLHQPLSYFEEQQKRLAWEQLQQKEPSAKNLDEDKHVRSLVPTGAAGYESPESICSEDSTIYHTAEDSHSDLSTSSTDYHTAVSDQENDLPRFISPTIIDRLASQILETQKDGATYTCDKGVKAAQSRGRLILPVGAAANDSPRSDSSVSTVDGFLDVPF